MKMDRPGARAGYWERVSYPQMEMLCPLGQAGAPVLGEAVRELLRGLLPLPWWGSSLGTWELRGVTASVILSRATDIEVLPLQVERVDGEGRGEESGGGQKREDRCPDRWAWPPALPSLMRFLPGLQAGQ